MKSFRKLIVIALFVSSGSLFAANEYYDGCAPKRSHYNKHHYKNRHDKKHHYEKRHHKRKNVVVKRKYRNRRSQEHSHSYHHKPIPRFRYDSCYGWTLIF